MAELAIASSTATPVNTASEPALQRPQPPAQEQKTAADSRDQVSLSQEALALSAQDTNQTTSTPEPRAESSQESGVAQEPVGNQPNTATQAFEDVARGITNESNVDTLA